MTVYLGAAHRHRL